MHIPDGFLDARTAVAAAALSAAGLGITIRSLTAELDRSRIPLIGLSAAFLFAAQMINFPVIPGVSGHLMGAMLAAVLLGPQAAILALSSVIILQCLLFADGGLAALGANLFNLALLAPLSAHCICVVFRRLFGNGSRNLIFSAALGAWLSTVAAALAAAGELAHARIVPWQMIFPLMGGIHMLIGLGEAAITALVLSAILKTRPDLLAAGSQPAPASLRVFCLNGLLISAGLGIFVAPFACGWPDGLQWVFSRLGLAGGADSGTAPANLIAEAGAFSGLSLALPALAGVLAALILSYVLARLICPAGAQPSNSEKA